MVSAVENPEVEIRPLILETKVHDKDQAKEIISAANHILNERQWDVHDMGCVRLALDEALTNALQHGHQYDATKTVKIEMEFASHRFRARIEDQGSGFDLGAVPDPTADENLEKESGRGILLMRSFATVTFEGAGNIVIIEKSIDD